MALAPGLRKNSAVFFHVDPNSKLGKAILLLGIPIFGAFLYFQLLNFSRAIRSLWWPRTSGTVTVSEIERVTTMHGTHHRANIHYDYAVAGARYQNDTIAFGLFRGMLTWGHADRKVRAYPRGQPVTVFFDPKRPNLSCLEPGGLAWEDVVMLIVSIAGLRLGAKTFHDLRSRRRSEPFPVTSTR